jgi:hypothetical protein
VSQMFSSLLCPTNVFFSFCCESLIRLDLVCRSEEDYSRLWTLLLSGQQGSL